MGYDMVLFEFRSNFIAVCTVRNRNENWACNVSALGPPQPEHVYSHYSTGCMDTTESRRVGPGVGQGARLFHGKPVSNWLCTCATTASSARRKTAFLLKVWTDNAKKSVAMVLAWLASTWCTWSCVYHQDTAASRSCVHVLQERNKLYRPGVEGPGLFGALN